MQRVILLACVISLSATADEIKPFTTDGCSMFPDGNIENNVKWMQCCIRHDYAYWKGGTEIERKEADEKLKQCVSDLGEDHISTLIHLGVRFGGEPYFPTWYRWGYGWPYLRGYQELSEAERDQVKNRIVELNRLLNEFIEDES